MFFFSVSTFNRTRDNVDTSPLLNCKQKEKQQFDQQFRPALKLKLNQQDEPLIFFLTDCTLSIITYQCWEQWSYYTPQFSYRERGKANLQVPFCLFFTCRMMVLLNKVSRTFCPLLAFFLSAQCYCLNSFFFPKYALTYDLLKDATEFVNEKLTYEGLHWFDYPILSIVELC